MTVTLGEPTVEEFFESYQLDPGLVEIRELMGNQETSEFDAKLKHGDLTSFFHYAIRSVKDNEGDVVSMFGTIQDITERKQVEEALRESEERFHATALELQAVNKELETFNHTVAHDLRQPLNLLSMCCQSIKLVCGDQLNEECMAYVRDAYKATLRMDSLIGALLNLSLMSRVEPQRDMVNLSLLAQEVSLSLKIAEPERKVDFLIADGIMANCDAYLLLAVLNNLLGNSWKYTGIREKAVIEFGVRDIDGVPTYFVRDNGSGFDMTEADKLFAPFQRLPGAEKCRGFGIGLATVERIIQRHGGKVWAEGALDMGACFYFTLGVHQKIWVEEMLRG